MVTFLSFFLGLTVGVQTVEVAVQNSVATVELHLDGEWVARLEADRWAFDVDFGETLEPHSLEAVAFDDRGRELGRVEQLVNMPRAAAEASMTLADFRDGHYGRVELVWRTIDEADPESVAVFFDGEALELAADRRSAPLPPHDPERIHILSAQLEFAEEREARSELAFGGQYGELVNTELTSVAVDLHSGRIPTAETVQGWFRVGGREVRVVAVEKPRAAVFAVRERSAFEALSAMGRDAWQKASYGRNRYVSVGQYLESGLEKRDSLRYVLTSPRQILNDRGSVTTVFPVSDNLNDAKRGGVGLALTHPHPEEAALRNPQWLASAVALAGLKAAASNRARAVILILGPEAVDASNFEPAAVRGFLDILRVPLHVLRVEGAADALPTWGRGHDVDKLKSLNRAIKGVEARIKTQLIVWLDGTHLPQDIELLEEGRGRLRLVGPAPGD